MPTTAATVAKQVYGHLRARTPLIWITTKEEARAERVLFEAIAKAKYTPRFWDVAAGISKVDGTPDRDFASDSYGKNYADPATLLTTIREQADKKGRNVWVLRDFTPWITAPIGIPQQRQLRNLVRYLPSVGLDSAQAIIVLSTDARMPDELAASAIVMDWPLPDRDEIAGLLDAAIASLPESYRAGAAPNGTRDAVIDAALGLSGEEVQAIFAKSLVETQKIEPVAVVAEKASIIRKSGVLEWVEPIKGGLDAVGGLEVLKSFLIKRRSAYSKKARDYGLPTPKGVFLVGPPGTGKSLTAKAAATAWQVPLLKMDLGALKSKYVGDSEANLRKAFRTIEAIGPCVVWIDEIEKSLAGAVQGGADGGVSADALGALLTWMQDNTSGAFVVATANDASKLPPELLRSGRFDKLFWLDLPTRTERAAILRAALKAHGRGTLEVDTDAVVAKTHGFVGAEIAALVPEALFVGFAESREIVTADLLEAARNTVPLSQTAKEKIEAVRNWGAERATRASLPEAETGQAAAQSLGRRLDI